MSWLYPNGLPIAMSLVGYNAFLTGLFVYFKRKDSSGALYLFFSFMVCLWGVGLSFMLNNQVPVENAKAWGRFAQGAAVWIGPAWLHFVLVYCRRQASYKFLLAAVYSIAAMLSLFTFSDLFTAGFRKIVSIHYYPMPGPLFIAFTGLFVSVVSYSFLILFTAIRTAKSEEDKTDYKMVFYATLYGFGAGALSFLPVYGIPFTQYNLLLMPVWQFLFAYGLVRFRMFDFEALSQIVHRDKLAALGTLAASINHEIRNPLYVIQGLAESHLINLKEGVYKSNEAAFKKSSEVLEKTAAQATRAMEIMKRFAVFAKQTSRESGFPEMVSVAEVLEDVLPLVRHELELEKIRLLSQFEDSGCVLRADRRQVEEILFNLIVNVCQAIKQARRAAGGYENALVEVWTGSKGRDLIIEVRDNGPGMAAEVVKNIFKPFYTTKAEGTGLGLYITRQLVERNGGKITVCSRPGQGTTFRIIFKVCENFTKEIAGSGRYTKCS